MIMNSEWEKNPDIIGDIRYAYERISNMPDIKRPKRIECKKEIYDILKKDILNSVNIPIRNHDELIFPCGNPFDMLFVQTDFSKWSEEDMGKGYKVVY